MFTLRTSFLKFYLIFQSFFQCGLLLFLFLFSDLLSFYFLSSFFPFLCLILLFLRNIVFNFLLFFSSLNSLYLFFILSLIQPSLSDSKIVLPDILDFCFLASITIFSVPYLILRLIKSLFSLVILSLSLHIFI